MYRLYSFFPSGSGYKVRLLLHQLQLPYDYVEIQVLEGETRTTEFTAKNPQGKIPVLETEPGQFLWESNAILAYLAYETEFMPRDRWSQAKIAQWFLFEQGSLAPYLDASWFWRQYGQGEAQRDMLQQNQAPGYEALNMLEKSLQQQDFLLGNRYTVADIALYGHTHRAEEAGFSLADYPEIQAWLGRIRAQPHYIPLDYPLDHPPETPH